MPRTASKKIDDTNERIATLESRQDAMGENIERIDRNQESYQSEFHSIIRELNGTLVDMRITNEGIQKTNESLQKEIQQTTSAIQTVSANMTTMQTAINNFGNMQTQIDELKKEYKESVKKLHERIDGVDGKSKIDVIKLLVNGAVMILGGSAALTVALYVFFTYIFKIPGVTP